MQTASRPALFRHGLRGSHALGVSCLWVALFAGYTPAQQKPPDPEPKGKAEATPKPKATPKAEPRGQAAATGKVQAQGKAKPGTTPTTKPKEDSTAAAKAKRGGRSEAKPKTQGKGRAKGKTAPRRTRKRRTSPTFKMNPDAKWACDQQTVTLKPVWRGEKSLTFTFNIRNEGTADLKIKARGG